MKTREEVEELKRQWLKCPEWDLEKEQGFEDYHDELLKFRRSTERRNKIRHNREEARKHAELASKLCPMKFSAPHDADISYSNCEVEKCAWWHKNRECCSMVFLAHLEDIAEGARVYSYKNEDR